VLCLWAQKLQKAPEEVEVLYSPVLTVWTAVEAEVGAEVEVALQDLVAKYHLLDEMRAEAEAEAGVHRPLWKLLNAKLHVGFCNRVIR